jgi:hypothetical protein
MSNLTYVTRYTVSMIMDRTESHQRKSIPFSRGAIIILPVHLPGRLWWGHRKGTFLQLRLMDSFLYHRLTSYSLRVFTGK